MFIYITQWIIYATLDRALLTHIGKTIMKYTENNLITSLVLSFLLQETLLL